MIASTAYEGKLYRGQVRRPSRNAVPIPDDIVPITEAWQQICPDTSPRALASTTHGKGERAGARSPEEPKSFLKWRIHPIAKKMNIPSRLVTFQVMRHPPWELTFSNTRNHQRCARSLTPRQHQDHGRCVRAADTAKRPRGNQLANTGNFGAAAASC